MAHFVFHIRLEGVLYSTEYITRVTYSNRICHRCDIYVPCHIRSDNAVFMTYDSGQLNGHLSRTKKIKENSSILSIL